MSARRLILLGAAMPFSATLLFDPTATNSFVPSADAITFLVQWWLIVPPGRSATFTGAAVIVVCPAWYGKRTSASALAT